ncbi:hypothetical protein C4J81_13115 [Deltaproteobacteria bacterium Smac51]|nr:hypothetical protein C4J81_13115 [Deltaproteobacteria bacterium Smac51]
MNVLVCFKAVPDLDSLHEQDWRSGDGSRPETRFVKTIINPLDESALELALKLRDNNGDIGLTAMTIGDEKADAILKTLLALRFDEVKRLSVSSAPLFNPEAVAAVVAEQAGGNYDLIIMGGQSADGANGATPLLVAEKLGWPCLTEVSALELNGGLITVESQCDDGCLRLEAKPPLVLAIGNAPSTYLRVPTLKDRMSLGKRPVEILALNDVSESGSKLTPLTLTVDDHSRSAEIIDGGAAEKAAVIWRDHVQPWLGKRRR